MSFGILVTSLAPLVPLIQRDLQMSHSAMGSVMGAWQLVFIFSAIPCGMLLDRLGTQLALLIGGVLLTVYPCMTLSIRRSCEERIDHVCGIQFAFDADRQAFAAELT